MDGALKGIVKSGAAGRPCPLVVLPPSGRIHNISHATETVNAPLLVESHFAVHPVEHLCRATIRQNLGVGVRQVCRDTRKSRSHTRCLLHPAWVNGGFNPGAKSSDDPLAHMFSVEFISPVIFCCGQIEGGEHDGEVLEGELLDPEVEPMPVCE